MTFVSNKQVYREFTNDGKATLRDEDRYFVERQDDGGWKVVEPADRYVSADELGKEFGLWKDQKVTTGHLWWKKTVRPLDGKVDADEVVPMAEVVKQRHDSPVAGSFYPNRAYRDYDQLLPVNTDLKITPEGASLHTDWQVQGRGCLHLLEVNTNSYLVG